MTVYSQYTQLSILGALVLLCASIVYHDIRYLRIPNILTLLLAASGLAWAAGPLGQHPMVALANGIAGLALIAAVRWAYFRLRNRTGLGLGDVKLVGAACIWTGIVQLPWLILIACAVAFAHICVLYITTKNEIRSATKLPFGAHLAVALCYLVISGMPFTPEMFP